MNGIKSDLADEAEVIKVNLVTTIGRQLATRFEIRGAPTTLVVSPNGDIVYRHEGLPNRDAIVQEVKATLPD